MKTGKKLKLCAKPFTQKNNNLKSTTYEKPELHFCHYQCSILYCYCNIPLDFGLSGFAVWSSVVREEYIKAFEYPALLFLLLIMAVYFAIRLNEKRRYLFITTPHMVWFYTLLSIGFAMVYLKPDLHSYILPESLWFDKNHFMIGVISLIIGFYALLKLRNAGNKHLNVYKAQIVFLALAALSGFMMMIKFDAIFNLVRYAYTFFDIAIVGSIVASVIFFIQQQFDNLSKASKRPEKIIIQQ